MEETSVLTLLQAVRTFGESKFIHLKQFLTDPLIQELMDKHDEVMGSVLENMTLKELALTNRSLTHLATNVTV